MGDLGVYSVKFNKCITIKLVIVMCDAPVYSDVRCTVNHNRKSGCDMYVVGRHLERWTFSSEVMTIRVNRFNQLTIKDFLIFRHFQLI